MLFKKKNSTEVCFQQACLGFSLNSRFRKQAPTVSSEEFEFWSRPARRRCGWYLQPHSGFVILPRARSVVSRLQQDRFSGLLGNFTVQPSGFLRPVGFMNFVSATVRTWEVYIQGKGPANVQWNWAAPATCGHQHLHFLSFGGLFFVLSVCLCRHTNAR